MDLPRLGSIGPVTLESSCWGFLPDDCNTQDGWCVKLVSATSCSDPLVTQWNVIMGLSDTMVFSTTKGYNAPAVVIGWFADYFWPSVQDAATCSAIGAPDLNITHGAAHGTGVFTVVGNASVIGLALRLCVDYKAAISVVINDRKQVVN